MADLADIGVMGLAVMGANLARNAARHGFGAQRTKPPILKSEPQLQRLAG